MPANRKQPISARLDEISRAINNTLAEPHILDLLGEYNYDAARLAQGRHLCDAAIAAQSLQQVESGESEDATGARDAAWQVAAKSYGRLLKLARMALARMPNSAEALGLSGPRKQSLSGWLEQARFFYIGLEKHPEYMASLAEFGITPAKVDAARADLAALEQASEQQYREQTQAQHATEQRDATLDAVEEWMESFEVVFRLAVEEEPQLIETLGVVVA